MAPRRKYRTARGLDFDMETFSRTNQNKVAVGNLGGSKVTNARGDILGQGGKILKSRDDQVREYYRHNLPEIKEQSIKREMEMERRKEMLNPSVRHSPSVQQEVEFDNPADALKKLEEKAKEKEKPAEQKLKSKKRKTKNETES